MIKFIETLFNVGDTIYISQKGQEVSGKILSIKNSFLAIETPDGNIIGIKEEVIDSFSKEPLQKSHKDYVNDSRYGEGGKTHVGWSNRQNGNNYFHGFNNSGDSHAPRRERAKFRQYKPGDRIPLEFLAQRDPSLASSWKRTEEERRKSQMIKASMSALFDEVKRTADDMQLVIPAIGAIVELKPTYQFGFIDDMQTGDRYFYNRGDIVDPALINETGEGVEVVYQRGRNHKGATAKCVHLSHTIEHTLEIAMGLIDNDDFHRAKMVIQNATDAYPTSKSANKMLANLSDLLEENGIPESNQDNSLYTQARSLLEQRDYAKALDVYKQCMDKGVRKVNCVKEVAQVYISLHAQERDETKRELIRKKGLEFIEEHKSELPDKPSTKFSLENIYFALGDYDKHIDIAEDIIAESGSNGDLPQYVFYLNKAAQSYLRIKDYARALDAANQGLEVEPENPHLLKTKTSIEEAMANSSGNEPDEDEEEPMRRAGGVFGFLRL